MSIYLNLEATWFINGGAAPRCVCRLRCRAPPRGMMTTLWFQAV